MPEKRQLDLKYRAVLDHCTHTINASFRSEVVRQYLNKYDSFPPDSRLGRVPLRRRPIPTQAEPGGRYFVTVIGLFLVGRPVRYRRCAPKWERAGAAVARKWDCARGRRWERG